MVAVFMIPVISIWAYSFFGKNNVKELSNIELPPFPDFGADKISEQISALNKTKDEAIGLIKSESEKAEMLKILTDYANENESFEGIAMEDLKIKKFEKLENSWHVEFKQYYKGIAVEESKASFIINDKEKTVTSSDIELVKNINIDIEPAITQEKASEILKKGFEANILEIKKSELVIYENKNDKNLESILAWKINAVSQKTLIDDVYYVNAMDGKIILQNKLLDEK